MRPGALMLHHVHPMETTGKLIKDHVYIGPEGYPDAGALRR